MSHQDVPAEPLPEQWGLSPIAGAPHNTHGPLGATVRKGVAWRPETDRQAGLEDTLYPVIVPSNNSSTIPGVLEDCELPESYFTRKIICPVDGNHFSYTKSGTTCGKPTCPRHWKTWALRAASRAAMRVNGYREASHKQYAPNKVIFSEDDESPLVARWRAIEDPVKQIQAMRAHFVRQALAAGVTGGAIVVHPWRTNDHVPSYLEGERRWDWVRKQGAAWIKYVKFSPHAHVTGYGFLKPVMKGDKFRYKNMGHIDTVDALESVLYYNLSHAAIVKGTNALSYFGCCTCGKLKQVGKVVRMSAPVVCPECGAHCVYEDSWDDRDGGKYMEGVWKARPWAQFQIHSK